MAPSGKSQRFLSDVKINNSKLIGLKSKNFWMLWRSTMYNQRWCRSKIFQSCKSQIFTINVGRSGVRWMSGSEVEILNLRVAGCNVSFNFLMLNFLHFSALLYPDCIQLWSQPLSKLQCKRNKLNFLYCIIIFLDTPQSYTAMIKLWRLFWIYFQSYQTQYGFLNHSLLN